MKVGAICCSNTKYVFIFSTTNRSTLEEAKYDELKPKRQVFFVDDDKIHWSKDNDNDGITEFKEYLENIFSRCGFYVFVQQRRPGGDTGKDRLEKHKTRDTLLVQALKKVGVTNDLHMHFEQTQHIIKSASVIYDFLFNVFGIVCLGCFRFRSYIYDWWCDRQRKKGPAKGN